MANEKRVPSVETLTEIFSGQTTPYDSSSTSSTNNQTSSTFQPTMVTGPRIEDMQGRNFPRDVNWSREGYDYEESKPHYLEKDYEYKAKGEEPPPPPPEPKKSRSDFLEL